MEILFTSLAFGLGFGAGALSFFGVYFIFIRTHESLLEEETTGVSVDEANQIIQQDSYARHGIIGYEEVSAEKILEAKNVIINHILEVLQEG